MEIKYKSDINLKGKLLKKQVFTILIFITVIQQLPFCLENFYGEIRIILYIAFGISTFFAVLNKNNYKKNIVKFMIGLIIYTTIISIISILDNSIIRFDGVIELIIPLGILLCSLNTKFEDRELNKIIDMYVLLATVLGIYSILYYDVGFKITQTYSIKSKNQIGPIIGIAIIITLYKILNRNIDFRKKKIYFLINVIEFVALFLSLIIFRNRSSILGVIIVGIIMVLKLTRKKLTYKNIILIIFTIIVLLILYRIGALDNIIKFIWDSFTLNYNINDFNSLSAGRTEGYIEAIKFSLDNPILGQLSNNLILEHSIHNYVLNKWIRYGIIGSLPLIVFYFALWKKTISSIFLKVSSKRNNMTFYLFLFSLIVSIFEYTYPFGPGVSQIMLWFLLGQYLNNSYK